MAHRRNSSTGYTVSPQKRRHSIISSRGSNNSTPVQNCRNVNQYATPTDSPVEVVFNEVPEVNIFFNLYC